MKSFTNIEQSKKLAEILPLESADNYYSWHDERYYVVNKDCPYPYSLKEKIPCWSLAALLEYMNRNFYNISLNYCGAEYTISFDDGERFKTITKDYSIDAAFEMVIWLKENNRI